MGRYTRFGALLMRWTAVALFVIAVVFLFFGVSGVAMTSSTMLAAERSWGPGSRHGLAPLWRPAALSGALAVLLFVLGRALGSGTRTRPHD